MKKKIRATCYGGLLLPLLLTGCHTVLGFSTATKFGLDISQRADQMIDVTMGYDRSEVASIPAPKGQDASGVTDKACAEDNGCSDAYSVLGTFEVDYGNPFLLEPVEIRQFFATGMAARKAAKNSDFQQILGNKAGHYATDSALQSKNTPSQQSGGKP